MLANSLSFFLLSLSSFVAVYLFTPPIAKKLKEKRIISKDLHRINKVELPNAGGLSIILGFSAAFTLVGLLELDTKTMLLVYLIGVLSCLLGLIDDILFLSKKTLAILSLLIGFPFLTYHSGSTFVTLTPFGPQDIGILFWPLALLGVAFLANAVNIYAGFNGLEAGLGLITSTSLGICSLLYGSMESALILFILSGALLAFLKYNFYPAKIFIGNSGTYLTGAVIASAIVVGAIKTAGLIACIPYILNFTMRLIDRLTWTVGDVTPDGKIISNRITALWSIFMYKRPAREKYVVLECWILQSIFGLLAILYAYISVFH